MPFPNPVDRDRAKWIYLIVSAVWLGLNLLIFVAAIVANRSAIQSTPQSPLSLLVALAAVGGLAALRWLSLASHANDPSLSSGKIEEQGTAAGTALTSSYSSSVTRSIFGTDIRFRLTWLFQSLATLLLVLMIATQWRPLILALLFASLLVGMEVLWLLCRLDRLLMSQNLPTTATKPLLDSTKPALEPGDLGTVSKTSSDPMVGQEEITSSFVTTKEYDDLQTLREALEHEQTVEEGRNFVGRERHDDDSDSEQAKPSQWQRDYRDRKGFGRLEGGVFCDFGERVDGHVILIGFVPPFPSKPELLAECDAEDFFEVKILQCSPIGAKVEIRPTGPASEECPSHVELVWEATLETSLET